MAIYLGEGIICLEAVDEEVEPFVEGGGVRFLDHLLLPVRLSELTEAQIWIINRFREGRMRTDAQFGAAWGSRAALVAALEDWHVSSLLEIGCGKFPLAADLRIERYIGLERDQEALEFCAKKGLRVGKLGDLGSELDQASCDAVVSLYAFHFQVEEVIERASGAVGEGGVFVFNMIVDDSAAALDTLCTVSRYNAGVLVVKTAGMARREYFFVASSRKARDAKEFSILLESKLALAHQI